MGNVVNSFGGSRNTQQQRQLSNDLLRQNNQEVDQHGGPLLSAAIAFLSKILPCSEALLGRLIWVLVWSWKAAPVALYESLLRRDPKSSTTDNSNNNAGTSRSGLKMGQYGNDISGYFQKWWQKTFVVPTALGFYYFMYDYVSEPVLDSVGCCSSDLLATGLGVGMLVVHFVSGVTMHLCQQRKAKALQEEQQSATNTDGPATDGDVELRGQQQQAPPHNNNNNKMLDNNSDHRDWVTMEKAHAAATGAISDYQTAANSSSNNNSNSSLPSPQALFNSVKEKKRKFWPFGKKKSNSNTFSSNAPPSTAIV